MCPTSLSPGGHHMPPLAGLTLVHTPPFSMIVVEIPCSPRVCSAHTGPSAQTEPTVAGPLWSFARWLRCPLKMVHPTHSTAQNSCSKPPSRAVHRPRSSGRAFGMGVTRLATYLALALHPGSFPMTNGYFSDASAPQVVP